MLKAPFSKPLPRQGDPRKFAQHGTEIDGFVPVASLPRLVESLESEEGNLSVRLHFHVNEERKRVVTGEASGHVSLVCQRCLESVQVPVTSNISLGIVWDEEEAKKLPESLDPWITGEGLADFFDMIEEEILLSLPAVAYHETACVDSKLYSSGEPVVEVKKPNPFQVLEQLKSSPKKAD